MLLVCLAKVILLAMIVHKTVSNDQKSVVFIDSGYAYQSVTVFTLFPVEERKHCDEHACPSVCLSARISYPHVQTPFRFDVPVAVVDSPQAALSYIIRYVLPLVWITSCLHVVAKNRRRV